MWSVWRLPSWKTSTYLAPTPACFAIARRSPLRVCVGYSASALHEFNTRYAARAHGPDRSIPGALLGSTVLGASSVPPGCLAIDGCSQPPIACPAWRSPPTPIARDHEPALPGGPQAAPGQADSSERSRSQELGGGRACGNWGTRHAPLPQQQTSSATGRPFPPFPLSSPLLPNQSDLNN